MKRTKPLVLFVLAIITLVLSIVFLVYGLIDINATLQELAINPEDKTALSYFGIGWVAGIGLWFISSIGLVFSIISSKINQNVKINLVSYVLIVVFVLLLVLSSILFFM